MDQTKAVSFLRSLSKCMRLRDQLLLEERHLRYMYTDTRPLLPDNEYRVILKKHIEKKPLSAIGKEMDISRQRVKQIEQRGLERLRAIVKKSPHVLPEISDKE